MKDLAEALEKLLEVREILVDATYATHDDRRGLECSRIVDDIDNAKLRLMEVMKCE